MAQSRLDLGAWLLRLLSWDGLLPVGICLAPALITMMLPGHPGTVELAAVFLPIAAFFLRFRAGGRQIGSNHCGAWVRRFQWCALVVGLLMLILFDAFVILSWIMPVVDPDAWKEDLIILGTLVGLYGIAMAVAMYPGRVPVDDPFDF